MARLKKLTPNPNLVLSCRSLRLHAAEVNVEPPPSPSPATTNEPPKSPPPATPVVQHSVVQTTVFSVGSSTTAVQSITGSSMVSTEESQAQLSSPSFFLHSYLESHEVLTKVTHFPTPNVSVTKPPSPSIAAATPAATISPKPIFLNIQHQDVTPQADLPFSSPPHNTVTTGLDEAEGSKPFSAHGGEAVATPPVSPSKDASSSHSEGETISFTATSVSSSSEEIPPPKKQRRNDSDDDSDFVPKEPLVDKTVSSRKAKGRAAKKAEGKKKQDVQGRRRSPRKLSAKGKEKVLEESEQEESDPNEAELWEAVPTQSQKLEIGVSWERLIGLPFEANLTWVKEFFATIGVCKQNVVTIRGREVNWSLETINRALGLQTPFVCHFNQLVAKIMSVLDEDIAALLVLPGQGWSRDNKRLVIITGDLNPNASLWFQFLRHNIMPSAHDGTLSREKCFLLYCIMKKLPIDVGPVAYAALAYAASRTVSRLIFPSLITKLMKMASVPCYTTDQTIQVANLLSMETMERRKRALKGARPARTAHVAVPTVLDIAVPTATSAPPAASAAFPVHPPSSTAYGAEELRMWKYQQEWNAGFQRILHSINPTVTTTLPRFPAGVLTPLPPAAVPDSTPPSKEGTTATTTAPSEQ
ncbi:hypothetical protein L6452_39417 [Arctium lappa]|uniref:Uncharacterized protein n=1 Tax=Arctium lappa TaxID=4217 RepID=A0ACB8XS76_ARCLA|nr:hypothetical protein L6452_39417 [Arctium lappa]